MISLDWTIVIQFGIFMLAVAILNLVLFKPVLKTIEERDSRTRGNEEEAQALSKKTEIKVHSYKRRLSAARQRASDERRRIVKEGSDAEKKRLEEARVSAVKIIEDAAAVVAKEKEEAKAALSGQVQALAVEIAGKIAGRKLGSTGGEA